MGKKVFHEILSLEEALHSLIQNFKQRVFHPLPAEKIKVKEALGRVTAEPVFAKRSSPYFHSAAMDGYAVHSKDTFNATEKDPVLLKIGEQALWIETGDPLPEGFDAVIPVEEVNVKEGFIEIYKSYPPYHDVRPVGEDIVATEMIIPENHFIRPFEIGAMLASGILEVVVRKKPKVGIIPTGSELLTPEEAEKEGLNPPSLIEYNSSVLKGLLEKDGAEVKVYPIAKDDEFSIKSSIEKALIENDMVLLNAGSGYGKEDFTYKVLSELGEVIINGVAIKPGKPFIASFCKNKPVLGIPGYPVSAIFCYQLFVRPLIELYLGAKLPKEEKIKGLLSRQLSSPVGVDEFVRVKVGKVGEKYIVSPLGRGAGLLMSVVRADGYLWIPAGIEGFSPGKEVEVFLWRNKEEIDYTLVCIGSHDNTLDVVYNFLRRKYPHISLSSAHVGSMGGLIAIKKGEAHLAGTHLLDETTGEYNIPFIKRILPERSVVLVNLVYRIQGFIVKKGNPKNIFSFSDLTREDVVFINRQAGSGTRLLLDKHLKDLGINPSQIRGYDQEEYTHMGVAQAVASGRADVGLGIYAAAKALDLDFIPLAEERYDILIPKEFLDLEMVQAFLDIIRNDEEFKKMVVNLGGYDVRHMGKIIYEN
ncbi:MULTISPECIES: molybdopterin biosynthesis protein [Thermodesulfobacterium]|jgi:putative molybdopterin biosynthesis protein|uniref:Molybdopterin molybdenumtransferase n=2 Tax=Thermodesulfobacterium commune TaxID=1741 RepID=A0A075WUR2_9BACT|nr:MULTISPECIES: molybdopterin biosynthesis protein [Thermodesulfobacterium]KUJ97740.1 MAG: Molybdenum cofactor synthesis domain protein [Thermodesulfobacterium sp. 37_54]KUK19258.1 MAG: Molybdenum cofactor synthesis domain protein [Thermodesulfobacterium commune]AIH04695.1 LysR family transcriptional regulator [Thermodesulfobacterium commune DSM 2178]KUK37475.1 MAG: Molybdenum cofactor synthesis domain protein [Thermodesulfobacterium commune]MBZ4681287.1 LysR family transcriptional regulator 